jgi:hypothetical protein
MLIQPMNPSLLGALAAAFLAGLWLTTRRRPRPFLRSHDTSAVAALNRSQIAQVSLQASWPPTGTLPDSDGITPVNDIAVGAGSPWPASWPELPAPSAVRQRLDLLRQLEAWSQGTASDRRRAMALAHRWGHRSVLPLLRRGLRDTDPLVMAEAAAAMQNFRGRSLLTPAPSQISAAPRQVPTPAPSSSRPLKVLRTR